MVRDENEANKLTLMVVEQNIGKHKIIITIMILIVLLLTWFLLKKPTVTLIGDKVEKVSYKSEFIDSGLNVKYHGKDITNTVVTVANIDSTKLGEYEIYYKIPYLFGTYTYTRKVEVVDDMKPEITLKGDEEIKLSYGAEFVEPGYKAIDNYDGDVTEKVNVQKEQISEDEVHYIYSVTDSTENLSQKTRRIFYVDNTKPIIELEGSGTVVLNIGEEYKEPGAKATDERDGDLTDKLEISGEINTKQEGTYTVTYKVKDSSNNEAIVTRQIMVGTIGQSAMNVGAHGVVYLTFDDGPSTSITPRILDTLKEKGVKATFFVIDYGEGTEHLVKRIVEEGHTIAIHTKSHDYATAYSSPEAYLDGLEYMREKIKKSTGVDTKIIRFPGGSSNTVSRKYYPEIMTILTKETIQRGYRYFDWNVASGDSGGVTTPEGVYENVTNGLKQDRSNVVLMHDFSGNNKTADALAGIIDYAKSNGYTFDRITDKTPMVTHAVQN